MGHFHYVSERLCDNVLFLLPQLRARRHKHMQRPERAQKHTLAEGKTHGHFHDGTDGGWRWRHTHRLSSGDRLSVKKEQFWLSISANLHTHVNTKETHTWQGG